MTSGSAEKKISAGSDAEAEITIDPAPTEAADSAPANTKGGGGNALSLVSHLICSP